jgi:D-Tyr-tRNAtyr deacylase
MMAFSVVACRVVKLCSEVVGRTVEEIISGLILIFGVVTDDSMFEDLVVSGVV